MNDEEIVILRRGDPCPLCGQPIRTADEATLRALTAIQKWLDVADMAGAAFAFLKNNREPEWDDYSDDQDGI